MTTHPTQPPQHDPIADLTGYVVQGFSRIEARMNAFDGRLNAFNARFDTLDGELRSIRADVAQLGETIGSISVYATEIDDILRRVAAIEKHLGITQDITI